jgi:nitrite reductase (cytochrome c-552)
MKPGVDSPPRRPSRRRLLLLTGLAVLFGGLAFGVTALLVKVFEHRQEARNPFFRVVELDDDTVDPEIWGKNFPLQYDGYLRTVDMVRTKHGGSEALPRTPTDADPRTEVARSRLEADPRLKVMWAGYPFSVDFREKRGHAYMLVDQTYTERVRSFPQPGTCLNCHASAYVAYKQLGEGDVMAGFDALNRMSFGEARALVEHPVSCIDCHDAATMQLRITRPAFVEGIRAAKAAEGIPDYDVHTMATRQEMRSYVCGQCHVEYYFQGEGKRLTFPWAKGLGAEQVLAYFDETGFHDWIHAETGAPMLKAQHPEFEMWSQGIHARAGVACADCHMPYMRVGALKISDHHVRSPLLNIAHACQTCHRVSEPELLARAEGIQDRTHAALDLALNALMDLIAGIQAAREAGATDDQLAAPRDFQRKATFLIDYVEAENSSGFHADQESMRLLVLAIDYCRKGQAALIAP